MNREDQIKRAEIQNFGDEHLGFEPFGVKRKGIWCVLFVFLSRVLSVGSPQKIAATVFVDEKIWFFFFLLTAPISQASQKRCRFKIQLCLFANSVLILLLYLQKLPKTFPKPQMCPDGMRISTARNVCTFPSYRSLRFEPIAVGMVGSTMDVMWVPLPS